MSESICECCELNRIEVRDYRDLSDQGLDIFAEFYVCRNCFHLNNFWFLKLMNAKGRGKKRVINRILEGDDWRKWLID